MTIPVKIILAVIAVGVAILAYVQFDRFAASRQMQEAAQPVPIQAEQIPASPEEIWLGARLTQIATSLDAEVGIAVQDVQTGAVMAHDGGALYPQHSVSKLWVAAAALDKVDDGEIDLDDMQTIGASDLTLFYQPIRSRVLKEGRVRMPIRALMELAIMGSDNTANDAVLRAIGGVDAVENFLMSNDLDGIRFGLDERRKQSLIAGLRWRQSYALERNFYDARDAVPMYERTAAYESYLIDPVDGAQPVAVVQALTRLAKGELLSERSTRILLTMLAQARSGPRRLKGGLPTGWAIAHKTGTGQALVHEQTGYNDVGIVTAPDGRQYSVAVFIRRTEELTPARQDMMHSVIAAIADYHAANDPKNTGGNP